MIDLSTIETEVVWSLTSQIDLRKLQNIFYVLLFKVEYVVKILPNDPLMLPNDNWFSWLLHCAPS